MLHYILIFLTYLLFIGIACDPKFRNNSGVELRVPIIFGAIYIFMLTVLYEKLLVYILLNHIHSHEGYIAFSAIGSGLYSIFYFAGLIILGRLMACPTPNMWTIIVFVIALIANIYLITRATGLYYDAMLKNFGDDIFNNFYISLSETKRPDIANTFLNLKWIVMIIPSVFYQFQIELYRTAT
ncbi:MAG: hypothetical protein J5517_10960 [Eubacterium sp.]|nr:hypothetical protein [Eubacterium sp.]